jgi:hypothetical protein
MGFFDRLVQPEPPERRTRRPRPRPAWIKPEAAIGAHAGGDLILARTPDAAIALSTVMAYPNGFEFSIVAVVREGQDRPMWAGHFDEYEVPDTFLRLGVRYADGRSATNLDHRTRPPASDAEHRGMVLAPSGGGGGFRRYDSDFWVWPLPPTGPVTIVCEWPAYGIAETSVDLDSGAIVVASARSVQLWPEEVDGDNPGGHGYLSYGRHS